MRTEGSVEAGGSTINAAREVVVEGPDGIIDESSCRPSEEQRSKSRQFSAPTYEQVRRTLSNRCAC
jgi:phage terminase large subunit-like protein